MNQNDVLSIVARAIVALGQVRQSPSLAELKTDVEALNAKLRSKLPANADGTPWTDADVEAAAAKAEAPFARIDRKHMEKPTGPITHEGDR